MGAKPGSVGGADARGGYTVREAARLLGMSEAQVRGYLRAGLLEARPAERGGRRFSLQDLVLLRTAKELAGQVPMRRVRRALRRLRERLPSGQPLTAVRVVAEGSRVLVCDNGTRWEAESGQARLDFRAEGEARAGHAAPRALPRAAGPAAELTADDWYDVGCDLESSSFAEAVEAYRRALELDSGHPDACVNLGRLLHESGRTKEAADLYRRSLEGRPGEPTAAFNLGVALEDLGQEHEARGAYEAALQGDPDCADAHYNLARLCEKAGDRAGAIRHLLAYRKLTAPPG